MPTYLPSLIFLSMLPEPHAFFSLALVSNPHSVSLFAKVPFRGAWHKPIEPRHQKTCLRGLLPVKTLNQAAQLQWLATVLKSLM